MAIHLNGVDGPARGKLVSHVYGAARTYYGKLTTSRAWTIPFDPQTVDQVQQRAIFQTAVTIATKAGSEFWRRSWNNSWGKLPGWHSWISWWCRAMFFDIVPKVSLTPPSHSLGPVHMPTFTAATGSPGKNINLTWDTTLVGDHSDGDDELTIVAVRQLVPQSTLAYAFRYRVVKRSVGSYTLNVPEESVPYSIVSWFTHVSPQVGRIYSPIASRTANSSEDF